VSEYTLSEVVEGLAAKFGIPGVAAGVWADGAESYAVHGVTSTGNPLPVDRDTLFLLGSVTKSYTASALLVLAEQGRVALDAPVRRYLPEFTLPDENAAAEITVLQLLNHTAGLEWRLNADTGEGDDALAGQVACLARTSLITPPGTRASYSQVGFNVLGRIIEKVTGLSYEKAVAALLLEPLGLDSSVFALNDVMVRRFAVGHNLAADGTLAVVRQWKDTRGNNPGAGLAASVSDLLAWGRFHLGDGRGVLGADWLGRMRQPTVELRGSSLADAFGLCWFLKQVGEVATVGHGGSSNGQFADLLLVPGRDFAIAVMSNAGPDSGLAFNQAVIGWALEEYLGVAEQIPEPLPYDPALAAAVAGSYGNEMMVLTIADDGAGLSIACAIRPEIRASEDTELPPDLPAASMGLLPGDSGEFIVTDGGLAGQRGIFIRDASGTVAADLAGRTFTREPAR
jgi:CubicO group peptidase (beta-lactamase class C family)